MIIERSDTRCIVVKLFPDKAGWQQSFLLSSDRHHDNVYCDQKLEKKHLDEAKERKAGIIDFGDLFCAMQGKYDPRASMGQFRPELRVSNYLDTLVDYVADFYLPYAEQFVMLGVGNHEDSIHDRHQTNLTARLVKKLQEAGSQALEGTYNGWVRFQFESANKHRQSINLWYTHGYGGGGPVTRDMIQAANRQVVYTDADIMCSGHTHDSWACTVRRESLTTQGKVRFKDIEVIKTGCYKDDYAAGAGYVARKGHPPKPMGGYWLTFKYSGAHNGSSITFETQRAK